MQNISYKRRSEKSKTLLELTVRKGQNDFDLTLDFKITSAVINNCDYVISSDSSLIHSWEHNVKCYNPELCPKWRWTKRE